MEGFKFFNKFLVFLCLLFVSNLITLTKCDNLEDVEGNDNELIDLWFIKKSNSAKEIFEATKMYREIERRQEALSELHHSTRRYLREENANMLAEVLSANGSSIHFDKLNDIYENLKINYDMRLTDDIFEDALGQVFNEKSPFKLLDDLLEIYHDPEDVKLFELMIRAILTLNALHNSNGESNDEYLQKFALIIYKIKYGDFFQNLEFNLKSRIEKVIAQLPDYLQYLMFKPFFCLLNVGSSEFMYSAVNSFVDSNSRYLWLWYEINHIDKTGHTKADLIDGVATSLDDLKITLRGTEYDVYYYMMPKTNIIAGYPSSRKEVFNHIWNVHFIKENVVLYQNEHIMCSIDRHDRNRGNIKGFKNVAAIDADNPKCQWSIGSCDRR